jgi:hypothetical protein
MTIMGSPSASACDRIDRPALAISAALLVLSVGAVALQHLALCGGCAINQGSWTLVAPLGVLGYGALTAIGCRGPGRLFTVGAAVAAGIHTVLVLAMLARGRLCLPCGVAAVLATALFVVTLARSGARGKTVAFAYLPAVILASGPATWALARERAAERGREAFIRAVRAPGVEDCLSIQVFEQDNCGYCRDFREFFLPRLEREFGNQIRVNFHAATETGWVRRTPTIVIEAGPVYEGLPKNYLELRLAVEEALAARK